MLVVVTRCDSATESMSAVDVVLSVVVFCCDTVIVCERIASVGVVCCDTV